MKALKKKELGSHKKKLLQLRDEMTQENQKNLHSGMESSRDDLKDIDDFAQNENDVDIWAISNNKKHEILIKIENALDRVDNKTYGYCESCKEKIGDARIKAIPYTDLCIKCQEKQERTTTESSNYFHPTEEFPDDDGDKDD